MLPFQLEREVDGAFPEQVVKPCSRCKIPTTDQVPARAHNLSRTASERRGNNLKRFEGLLHERQGQNLALTVCYVPYSREQVLKLHNLFDRR